MKSGMKWLIFFGLFWSAITLAFDYIMVSTAVRQLLALRFASAQGTILSSEVTEHDGEDGPTYGVKMRYSFSVGGQQLEGKRYRYDTSTTSGSGWARRVVRMHPPGERVEVFYNPRNPQDCILRPGITGSDLFHFVFMTPFNAVMLGIWAVGWGMLRRKWFKPPAGGVKLRMELRKTRARLVEFSPLSTGIATCALLAFGSIFVIGFGFGGFHPAMKTMTVTWTVILTGGLFAAIWHALKIASGNYDLVLDSLNGTVQLPLTCGRRTSVTVPMAKVHGAFVIVEEKRDSDSTTYTYFPTLRLEHGDGPTEKLAEWHFEEKAREFVAWLNEQLGTRPSQTSAELKSDSKN